MWPDSPSKSCSIWNAQTLRPLPLTSSTATSSPSGWPTRSAPESTIAAKPAPFTARSFSSSVPARLLVFMAKRASSSMAGGASGQRRDRAQRIGRDAAKTEELEVERDLLEEHVGANLGAAAALARGAQERRDRLLHHDLADEGFRS